MPAQWTGELVGRMHNAGISEKQLAAYMGKNDKYVSQVLNGHCEPKHAQQVTDDTLARTKEEQELYERAFEEARERRRGQHEQIVNRTQELLAQRVARDEQARMNAAVQQEPSVSQVQNEAQWPGGIMLPGTFGTNAQNMKTFGEEER